MPQIAAARSSGKRRKRPDDSERPDDRERLNIRNGAEEAMARHSILINMLIKDNQLCIPLM